MGYKKETKVCEHCNQSFLGIKTSKYCGYKCSKESRKRRVTLTCLECSKEFERQEWNSDAKYCSISCKAKNQSSEILKIYCTNCSKEFKRKDFKVYRNKSGNSFCSSECSNEFNRGGNHYEWKENLHDKHYKSGLKQWSKIVKRRDNFTCQLCGENSNKKLIEAHHIKSRKDFPELQFNFDNGISLCLKCHAIQHVNDPKALQLINYKINKYYKS